MSSKVRKVVFLTTAFVGLVVTWYFNIQFLSQPSEPSGLDFIFAAYANAASTSISNDIVVAAFTFLFWAYSEMKKLGMRFWLVYVLLTIFVALAFAFPLFMYMRERTLEARRVEV